MLGFIGPRQEAEEIKTRLAEFLRDDPKLALNQDKMLITHRRTGAARFLGYEINVQHADHKTTRGHRSANGKVALRVPRDVITSKSAAFLRHGNPERRPDLLNYPITRSSADTGHSGAATCGTTCSRRTYGGSTGCNGSW